ncbi:hypothetical protein KC867_00415 [Candidatus Saccharibacteria bacterium]|nr:hypothetical protein [Candidatus Saccharibacteria bacterium]
MNESERISTESFDPSPYDVANMDNQDSLVVFPETAEQERERIGRWFNEHYPHGLPGVDIESVQE